MLEHCGPRLSKLDVTTSLILLRMEVHWNTSTYSICTHIVNYKLKTAASVIAKG